MKLIIAIIRETQLDQVRESLIEAGINRITVGHVSGHGRRSTSKEVYRGQIVVPNLVPNIRLEIAVNDDFVKTTTDAIMQGTTANEDELVGSGKIFIMPIEECIRIRTGESGSEAI
ncbi:MAG: P-II family nitrogen regulator [Cyclobacteriaceae bacterium]